MHLRRIFRFAWQLLRAERQKTAAFLKRSSSIAFGISLAFQDEGKLIRAGHEEFGLASTMRDERAFKPVLSLQYLRKMESYHEQEYSIR